MIKKEDIFNFILANKELFIGTYRITKFGIFGSYARGDENAGSDIDLLIEFQENTPNLYAIKNEIKTMFRKKFRTNVDICREKYIKPIFKDDILKEAIYVIK